MFNITTVSQLAVVPSILTKCVCPVPKVNAVRPAPIKSMGNQNRGDTGKVEELTAQIMELKMSVEGLEKERDFYFGKLRDIEVMCQENDENNPLIQKILDVLYATEVSDDQQDSVIALDDN